MTPSLCSSLRLLPSVLRFSRQTCLFWRVGEEGRGEGGGGGDGGRGGEGLFLFVSAY